jgi:hypothetical protein
MHHLLVKIVLLEKVILNLVENKPPDGWTKCCDKECISHISTWKGNKLDQSNEVDSYLASTPRPSPGLDKGVRNSKSQQHANRYWHAAFKRSQMHRVDHFEGYLQNKMNTFFSHL